MRNQLFKFGIIFVVFENRYYYFFLLNSMQPNQITIQIKDNKPKGNPNMVALKKIQHFSYVMSDEIGLGFSSKVFKGKNDETNQLVAVKVIQLKNVEEVQFLNDQVIALQRIKKANPVHLLKLEGVFKTKNNLYIITEFCQGKDLSKILRKKKHFNQHQAQSIMKQLLKGYKQLYELQVVHRDLKLANIFVKNGQIKIADFGFAVAAETCDKKSQFNVGSPTYMSPQALKHNIYSYGSDVWAIGIMAYELIFGRPPWKDRNDAVLYDIMTNTPIDQLFSEQFPISQAYRTFIRKCLTVNIKERAKPQFIINFEWKMASDFIQGMDRLDGRPGTMVQLHQGSIPIIRQIKSNNNIELDRNNKQLRRNTVFHTGSIKTQNDTPKNSSIPKLESGNYTPKQQMKIIPKIASQIRQSDNNISHTLNRVSSKEFINQGQSYGNLAFSDNIAKKLKVLNTVEQNKKLEAQNLIVNDSFPDKKDLNRCQNAILSQIHYCRFLNMLFDEVNNKERVLPSKQLKEKIVLLLLIKVKKLTKMAKQKKNIFELPYFVHYAENDKWKKLKDTILQYQNKFELKYVTYKGLLEGKQIQQDEPIKQIRQYVKNSIVFLKPRVQTQTRLIEMLTNFYQLLDLHEKSIAINFGQASKIEFLVTKQLYQNIDTHRLENRLECLGL